MNDLLTTGQVAAITGLGQNTVIRLIDRGVLRGFRIPGGRARRVARRELEEFMRANGIPDQRAA
jgi:two-component system, OmpR family, response regulator VicR